MIGYIEKYAKDNPMVGIIKSDDTLYDFNIKTWRARYAPQVGDEVEFELRNGTVVKVKPLVTYPEHMQPVKSRIVAGVLGLTLGALGAHRIYLGFYGIAALQVAVTALTLGYGVLWGFVEGVLLLTSKMDKDAQGRPLKD